MPPSKNRKVKTVLYLLEKQVKELKKISTRLDVPMSQLIRDGVNLILVKHKK